jgi:hypothetical protein
VDDGTGEAALLLLALCILGLDRVGLRRNLRGRERLEAGLGRVEGVDEAADELEYEDEGGRCFF